MKLLQNLLIACLILVAPLSEAWAASIQQIVAFGDSLTDTGNYYALSGDTYPTPPYYNGRLSNGPVWIEQLASRLGVSDPLASLQGGTNYAYSDAETGSGVNSVRGVDVPNIGNQISSYLAANTPNANQLFVVWGGANDFFYGETDPTIPVENLKNDITALANAGASDFLVNNLPLLGNTPLLISLGIPAQNFFNYLSQTFNTLLDSMLNQLQSDLGITIHRLDVGSLFQNIQANPGNFGMTNVFGQAKSGDIGAPGAVVPNPDEYLFWDGVHPTAAAHQIIATMAASEIPEPSTLSMFVLGIVGLSACGWFKTSAKRREKVTDLSSGGVPPCLTKARSGAGYASREKGAKRA